VVIYVFTGNLFFAFCFFDDCSFVLVPILIDCVTCFCLVILFVFRVFFFFFGFCVLFCSFMM